MWLDHGEGRAQTVASVKWISLARKDARRERLRNARTAAAIVVGRAAGACARRLRLGAGTSLPGLVASRLDPEIVARLGAELKHGCAVVTGTNGKTTTSGLLAYVLRDAGMRIWRNREGANLLRGVTAALVIRAEPNGHLRRNGDAAAVFEVDEAAFPAVLAQLAPRAIVVTNLFRDQLDRYGEVDTVAERWRDALATASEQTAVALNADDPAIAALADVVKGPVLFYGVESFAPHFATNAESRVEVVDTRNCPRCRTRLDYSERLYSHIGHWRCPRCGYARPMPSIYARHVAPDGIEGMCLDLVTPEGAATVRLNLPGLYNVYNALAAAAAGHLMGASLSQTSRAVVRFTPAFGRAERIEVDGREVRILLAKNPTGLNEVFHALEAAGTGRRHLFLLLNDRPADGEDISWIWDADFERVSRLARSLVIGGTRANDLAVRLKYAGVPIDAASPTKSEPAVSMNGDAVPATECTGTVPVAVEPSIPRALDAALSHVPRGETLFVVPTYTAMLAVRTELERRGYAQHYWETGDP
jgi:UDP-N-acetylmuramyl tripeptide synthase